MLKTVFKKVNFFKTALIAFLALITFGLYYFSRPEPPSEIPEDAARIRFQAAREELVNTVEVHGKSSYVNETDIYAPFAGEVVRWNVKNGTQVKKGDVLFEMDAEDLRNDIALQEAERKVKELNLKMQKLQEVTSVLDAASMEKLKLEQEAERIRLEIADLELEKKREKLANAVYRAPADGIFLFAKENEPVKVEENEPLGKIVDLKQLQLVTSVGEYEVFHIREGMPVDVSIDALNGVKIKGTVESVSKFAKNDGDDDSDSGNTQFEVIIALEPHDRLVAGLNLTGKIETARKKNALVIPTLAVQREDDKPFVYVEKGPEIEKRPVEIGLETAEKTEIVKGLQEGETVVLQ